MTFLSNQQFKRYLSTLTVLVGALVIAAMFTTSAIAAEPIKLSVDASKTGAKIDRNIFGQFAEHLGHGIYEGIWVGPDSPHPQHPRHPQRRRRRAQGAEGARTSAGRAAASPTSTTGARASARRQARGDPQSRTGAA